MSTMTPPFVSDIGCALHQSRTLVDAPEALVLQAVAVFQQRPLAATTARPWRQLVAHLSFDSTLAGAATAAVRHHQADTRQLLFEADGREVELRISAVPGTDRWHLSGQVLGPEDSGWACLNSNDGYSAESTWSDLSEFSFEDVPPGLCTVVLRGGDWELFLPDLAIPRDI